MGTMTLLTNKLLICIPSYMQAANSVTNAYDSYLNITKTICATVLILSVLFGILFLVLQIIRLCQIKRMKDAELDHERQLKDKLLQAKIFEEKNFYRKKLVNVHEMLAKEKEVAENQMTKKTTETKTETITGTETKTETITEQKEYFDKEKCQQYIATLNKLIEEIEKSQQNT